KISRLVTVEASEIALQCFVSERAERPDPCADLRRRRYSFFGLLLRDLFLARCLHGRPPHGTCFSPRKRDPDSRIYLADFHAGGKWTPSRIRLPGTIIDDAEPCFSPQELPTQGAKS